MPDPCKARILKRRGTSETVDSWGCGEKHHTSGPHVPADSTHQHAIPYDDGIWPTADRRYHPCTECGKMTNECNSQNQPYCRKCLLITLDQWGAE